MKKNLSRDMSCVDSTLPPVCAPPHLLQLLYEYYEVMGLSRQAVVLCALLCRVMRSISERVGLSVLQGALANVRRGIIAAQAALAAAFLGLAFLFGIGQPLLSVPPVAAIVLGVAAFVARFKLKVMERKFVYADYVHAER